MRYHSRDPEYNDYGWALFVALLTFTVVAIALVIR